MCIRDSTKAEARKSDDEGPTSYLNKHLLSKLIRLRLNYINASFLPQKFKNNRIISSILHKPSSVVCHFSDVIEVHKKADESPSNQAAKAKKLQPASNAARDEYIDTDKLAGEIYKARKTDKYVRSIIKKLLIHIKAEVRDESGTKEGPTRYLARHKHTLTKQAKTAKQASKVQKQRNNKLYIT